MNNKLLLVDGMALLFRSFSRLVHRNFMINENGIPTNGVNGFKASYYGG